MSEVKAKKPFWKKWWVWVVAIIVIAAANGGEEQPSQPTQEASSQPEATQEAPAQQPVAEQPKPEEPKKEEPPANKPSMNKAEFDQLKSGMTYEEASAIIGGPGEVISESGNPGDQFHTVMYQYEGEGDLGANANLMFQGNKLQNKAQFGLK